MAAGLGYHSGTGRFFWMMAPPALLDVQLRCWHCGGPTSKLPGLEGQPVRWCDLCEVTEALLRHLYTPRARTDTEVQYGRDLIPVIDHGREHVPSPG